MLWLTLITSVFSFSLDSKRFDQDRRNEARQLCMSYINRPESNTILATLSSQTKHGEYSALDARYKHYLRHDKYGPSVHLYRLTTLPRILINHTCILLIIALTLKLNNRIPPLCSPPPPSMPVKQPHRHGQENNQHKHTTPSPESNRSYICFRARGSNTAAF